MAKNEVKIPIMERIENGLSEGKKQYVPLTPDDEESAEGKIVVITGANSQIGTVAARELSKRGATVVMCCRDLEKGEKVRTKIHRKVPGAKLDLIRLDMANMESIRKCAAVIKVKYCHINILINAAGILYMGDKLKKTSDGFEAHMGINYLGTFLFTLLLLDLVKASDRYRSRNRIVLVGSTMHLLAELDLKDLMLEKRGKSFGNNNYGPFANSKLATMYFARELTKKLEGTGVLVTVLCTGFVKPEALGTEYSSIGISWLNRLKKNMKTVPFASSVAEGADTVLYCSLSTRLSQRNGQMYRFNQVWPDVMDVLDELIAKELWEKSEKLVNYSYFQSNLPLKD